MSKYTFTVSGRGVFPVDMLRYDQCCPVFPGDAAYILTTFKREVRLNSDKYPTTDRWASFGWYVDLSTIEEHRKTGF